MQVHWALGRYGEWSQPTWCLRGLYHVYTKVIYAYVPAHESIAKACLDSPTQLKPELFGPNNNFMARNLNINSHLQQRLHISKAFKTLVMTIHYIWSEKEICENSSFSKIKTIPLQASTETEIWSELKKLLSVKSLYPWTIAQSTTSLCLSLPSLPHQILYLSHISMLRS